MSENDGFLSRWSRRKQAATVAPEEPDPAVEDISVAEPGDPEYADVPEAGGDEELSDLEIIEKYGLKDPDELGMGDDFAGFMRPVIPEHLRRRALRALWRSNPVLANLDGLNDYDGDLTGGSVPAGQLKTVYKVGLGIVRNVMEASDRAEQPANEPAIESSGTPDEASADESPASPADVENADVSDEDSIEISENARIPLRKRMIFREPGQ